jgi:hypothetical protein
MACVGIRVSTYLIRGDITVTAIARCDEYKIPVSDCHVMVAAILNRNFDGNEISVQSSGISVPCIRLQENGYSLT